MTDTLIDFSHAISAGMTKYPLQPDVVMDVLDSRLKSHVLHVASHVGTHVDAPMHAIEGGKRMDELDLGRFRGTAVVSSVKRGPGEEITIADILAGGPEPERDEVLLVHTGWDKYFDDEVAYEDHPWLADEVGPWAVEKGLSMVGIDAFSPDQPIERRTDNANFAYPIHRSLLGAEVLIIENLTRLEQASGRRGNFWAFPVYTLAPGGDAGHIRFVFEPLD